jgi:hypothetical protein
MRFGNMAKEDDIQVELPFDDSAGVAEVSKPVKEAKVAANDEQTPEEGIAELRERLEQEKKARIEAENRANQAQQSAHKASQDVQDSNLQLITGAIDKIKRETGYNKAEYRDALASGDYDKAADIQEMMSLNSAKLLQLENGRVSLENKLAQPQKVEPHYSNPVEEIAQTLSPRSAAWVRAHPECITNPRLYENMVKAHNKALDDGYIPDSEAYFDMIETRLGFKNRNSQDDGEDVVLSAASSPSQKRSAPPAAPTTRTASGTGNRTTTVRLDANQREMASMMGMTPEEYATNMVALRKEGKLN